MAKLKVLKGLRLTTDDLQHFSDVQRNTLWKAGSLQGAVYIEGDTVEPSSVEASTLRDMFPGYFEEV